MGKPTLIQKILRQPSTSYANPPPLYQNPAATTERYSAYQDLRRQQQREQFAHSSRTPSPDNTSAESTEREGLSNNSLDDVTTILASTSRVLFSLNHHKHGHVLPSDEHSDEHSTAHGDQDPESDADSLYFTPVSSPEITPPMSPKSSTMTVLSTPSKTVSAGTLTLSASSVVSTPSSITSTSEEDDAFTWSSLSASDITRATSPVSSENYSSKSSVRSLRSASSAAVTLNDTRWLPPPQRPDWTLPVPVNPHRTSSLSSSSSSSTIASIPFSQLGAGSVTSYTTNSLPSRVRSRRPRHRQSRSAPSSSRTMSFILEEDEDGDGESASGSGSGSITPPNYRFPPPSNRRIRAYSTPTSLSSSHSSRRSSYHSQRTVSIPFPLPASSGVSSVPSPYAPYGSLVLPRAAFTPSKHPDRISSQIDITKSGLAQTTMACIEIRRGAASHIGGNSALARASRISHGLFGGSAPDLSATPKHLLKDAPSVLAFASHTPPPNKLQSGQVLVQVFMVGLDGLDARVVRERDDKGGYGFVPGRSFVGRAVETGFEVRNVCRGDWVFGLVDLHKCGSLAEFIVVDRRRVYRAPYSSSASELSLEQIALLPLSGVPAHRAIRSLPNIGPDKTALVLNAHDGVGALLVHALSKQGVTVTAQVPREKARQSLDQDSEKTQDEEAPISFEERARLLGASHVKIGDPLVIISSLHEAQFDYVLDTVGGRRIWEASRWIMKSPGQFTTTQGDDPSIVPYMASNFKSNLRSMRGAIKRGSRGYEWVMPNAELDTEGEDIRDALGAVAKAAEAGLMAPWKKWAVPFESAPEAFVEGRGMLKDGGTVVVKIVG